MLLVLRSVSSMDKWEVSVARVLSEASLVTVAEARACCWRKVPMELWSSSSPPKVLRCNDGGTGRAGTVVDCFFFDNVRRI